MFISALNEFATHGMQPGGPSCAAATDSGIPSVEEASFVDLYHSSAFARPGPGVATTRWLLGLLALAVGLPATVFGQAPRNATPVDRVVITAPPLPATNKSHATKKPPAEVVISESSDKAVHEITPNPVALGSHVPSVISYYKGHAYLNSSKMVVDLVTVKGVVYAVIRGRNGGARFFRLGVAKS